MDENAAAESEDASSQKRSCRQDADDPHAPVEHCILMRCYQELNDFLPPEKRFQGFSCCFRGTPAVKDCIESAGIPHTEVDLILVDGKPVSFSRRLSGGERVAVYPVFESFDISGTSEVREKPLRRLSFVLDCHLGKLARLLRILGLDVHYERNFPDQRIAEISSRTGRIVLTRDVGLLKRSEVKRGYWLRSQDPYRQMEEVLRRFDLCKNLSPFTRCPHCNGILEPVAKEKVQERVKAGTLKSCERFFLCRDCGRIYWRGAHFSRLERVVRQARQVCDQQSGS
ncbi:MAG: Mut7-C ubiquitin/RNAse domain-containing protein [Spirochaetales bacterium]|nr:Mut7-C ubiquitin/RNAse domain-containing protein [Spirochaetales bacterium]MCF7938073.1 Mut7-C ubiquitin/RNAse domain-containing protein [Spirochaetales bacterium]